MSMSTSLKDVRQAYHKLIIKEWEKYEKHKRIEDACIKEEELREMAIPSEILDILMRKGLLLRLGEGRYRTLLTDVAFRASDIRVKHKGTKYVLETEFKLVRRPVLKYTYVRFDKEDEHLLELKNLMKNMVGDGKIVDIFLSALKKAGITGLSKYQFESIKKILGTNKTNIVISAPTAFGKTYIFIIPLLLEALRSAINKDKKVVALVFYPRKSLGSDQAGKLIKLLYFINEELESNGYKNVRITIGIDDGDTKERRKLQNGEPFRGIKCPIHKDTSLEVKDGKVYCGKCKKHFEFIELTKEDFQEKPPHIVISNIWALQYRLSNKKYWECGYFNENIKFFVFDESHVYRSLVGGVLRYLIRILRSVVSPNAKIILSSATIPRLQDFIKDIIGYNKEDVLELIYDEKVHGKDYEKLELYLLVGINPYTSWETYVHELAIFLSTVNRLRMENNENVQTRDTPSLQSLIFVDNIRSINRLYTQLLEALKLGDPEDHFNSYIEPSDPYCYWVYNEKYKLKLQDEKSKSLIEELRRKIKDNIGYSYSEYPERYMVEDKLRKGSIDVVFTTSTLELGVDYEGVSVVVNVGIPLTPESIIQRAGRAGRNEENTLNTSLSIIVIRNNPLEYFYLYRGIDKLLDTESLPKIPISYNNIFVILYSTMLYMLSRSSKKGRKLRGDIETLESIIQDFRKDKNEVISNLGIEGDISSLLEEYLEKYLESVLKVLKNPGIDEVCEKAINYMNYTYTYSEIRQIAGKLEDLFKEMNERSKELSERELQNFNKKMQDLENIINELRKQLEHKGLDNMRGILEELQNSIHQLKRSPQVAQSQSPLHEFRRRLHDLYNEIEKCLDNLDKIGELNESLVMFEKDELQIQTYRRVCDILQTIKTSDAKDNIITLIENFIGFKFMGSDFLDQTVEIKQYDNDVGPGEEISLANLMVRMPPFELINIPNEPIESRELTKNVGARHFWLIKPRHIKVERFVVVSSRKRELEDSLDKYFLTGTSVRYGDIAVPQSIEVIDILTQPEPIILRLPTKDGSELYIKYGSSYVTKNKVKGKYHLYENIIRLMSPDVKADTKKIILDSTINHLTKMDEEIQKRNPWGLNFRYVAMCKLGKFISTDPFDQDKCPIKKLELENASCEYYRVCEGTKYWNRYRRPFPKFHVKLSIKNPPEIRPPLLVSLEAKTYEEEREDIKFAYDTLYVSIPSGLGEYSVKEIEVEPIGYYARTSYVSLNFNPLLIDIIIDSILDSNKELLRLLSFKYYMYKETEKTSLLDASQKIFSYREEGISKEKEEFKKFVAKSLIHTLAHLFYIFLLTKVNVDPNRITYHISMKDTYSIYIFENSKNDGIGVVETVKSEMKNKGTESFLEEFYKWSLDFLEKHDSKILEEEKELKAESESAIKELELSLNDQERKELKNIITQLEDLNKRISEKIPLKFIDPATYRHLITSNINLDEEYDEYLLTLINSQKELHLCPDGCNNCIIFTHGCSEPFLQHYLLSKKLVIEFLKVMNSGGNIIVNTKGIGKIIKSMMERADIITIKTPFIDDVGIHIIKELREKGKKVKLITRERENLTHLDKLRRIGVEISIDNDFHSKIYCMNNEVCILTSANFTKSSLYEKEENAIIVWKKRDVESTLRHLLG